MALYGWRRLIPCSAEYHHHDIRITDLFKSVNEMFVFASNISLILPVFSSGSTAQKQ
jgi:hypothetical protein